MSRAANPSPSGQDRFVTLDGMRGLAALVVAGSHISELLQIGVPPHAHLAVDFFFVLSGFVIAHAYEPRLGTSMSALEFLRARIVRLHPLILLGSGLSLAMLASSSVSGSGPGVGTLLVTVAAGVLLIPLPRQPGSPAFPLDGPAWSLFAEYAVNILFALSITSLTGSRLRWVLAAGVAMVLGLAFSPAGLESYWRTETVGLSLLRVVYPFFAGVLISRLYRERQGRLPSVSPLVSMSALIAILLAPSSRFDIAFQFIMIVAAFPLLVCASARDRLTRGEQRWMLLGGRLSYPLYMLHFPLATLLVPVVAAVLPSPVALVMIMLLVLGASHLALLYYDEPVRAWLRSRLTRRADRALAA